MNIRIIKKAINILSFLCAVLLTVYIILDNDTVTYGAKKGVDLCLYTVGPSLFPVLILTIFASNIEIPRSIKKRLMQPLCFIAGSSVDAGICYLFGAISGYPVGVKTAASLFRDGKISIEEARRAAVCNINPGIAFSVLVVGKSFAGSIKIGFILYISITLSDFLLLSLLRFSKKTVVKEPVVSSASVSPGDALIIAVEKAIRNTAVMSGWIVAFSALFASVLAEQKYSAAFLFLEVTNGASFFAAAHKWQYCAFCMGFGGACLYFQLLPDLKFLKISVSQYIISKLFTACASYLISGVLFRIIPVTVHAFSQGTPEIKLNMFSTAGTCALFFMCLVFISSVCFNDGKEYNLKYNSCQ